MKCFFSIVLVLITMVPVSTLLLVPGEASAQDNRDQNETIHDDRIPNLPYYSYGRGLGLTTPDSTYQLNIRFRMQNRFTYISNEGEEERIQAEVRRLRLRFDGFVGDPSFQYAIKLSFSPGDAGSLPPGENINIIRDAVFFYRATENFNVGFGQTKLPGNRQRLNSSGALQLTDRSINNAYFNIDRDFGFFANYAQTPRDAMGFALRGALSTGDGRNVTGKTDRAMAVTGRAELYPFGAFTRNGTLFEGDLVREESLKLLLGGTWHFNAGAQRTQGQQGAATSEKRDLQVVLLDAMLKYRGWALMGAWMGRFAENPATGSGGDSPETTALPFYTGTGYDVQGSYLLPSNYEFIVRYSKLLPESEVRDWVPMREQLSGGITRYVWEHALKLQAELTYDSRTGSDGATRSGMYARFQIEIGI